jgi:putative glycosyltransferase (TIGR04372 family)
MENSYKVLNNIIAGKLSLKNYLFSYKSNIFFFILSIPFIFLIIAISPIITIRIGELRSRILGEFALPAEIYLSEIKSKSSSKKKNNIDLFFFNYKISNHYLANHWKKKLIILPRLILEPIFIFFVNYKIFKKFLSISPWKYETVIESKKKEKLLFVHTTDNNNLLKIFDVSMNFNNDEILFGNKLLFDNGYEPDQKIICFANRDGIFKKEKFTSIRNAEIETYKSGIEYLADMNFFNIRMGRNNQKKINFSKKNIFDYVFSNIKSDFMDLFIFSKCDFLISTNHGVDSLATFFRKKRLIINYTGFWVYHNLNDYYTPLVLPKKYKDLETQRFITYREIYQKKLFSLSPSELNERGYVLIDNSEEEIKDAIKDMYDLSKNNYIQDISVQENFWNMHKSFFKWKPSYTLICQSFFKKNEKLFK